MGETASQANILGMAGGEDDVRTNRGKVATERRKGWRWGDLEVPWPRGVARIEGQYGKLLDLHQQVRIRASARLVTEA